MSGSLVLVNEVNVTSGATASITGIDSTYDVYKLQFNNVVADTDDKDLNFRFTVSGTADSSANYSYGAFEFRDDISFPNRNGTGSTYLPVNISGQGTNTGESCNGIMYAFNHANAGDFSFVTMEIVSEDFADRLMGWQGGGALLEKQATNGFEFFWESSANFASGTFRLYGFSK
jgi:hypothetical protein|tara:strand:- start:53 stop:574 length:522 start_codon:yes stop_codon:yes gene_type:complete